MLPRSYDERVIKPHSVGFKYPTVVGTEFGEATLEMQTKEGRERIERTIKQHQDYVMARKAEEYHYLANKRSIVADKHESRWAPASCHGQQFREAFCDPNYLFKKSL